jgi:hypothetical protein
MSYKRLAYSIIFEGMRRQFMSKVAKKFATTKGMPRDVSTRKELVKPLVRRKPEILRHNTHRKNVPDIIKKGIKAKKQSEGNYPELTGKPYHGVYAWSGTSDDKPIFNRLKDESVVRFKYRGRKKPDSDGMLGSYYDVPGKPVYIHKKDIPAKDIVDVRLPGNKKARLRKSKDERSLVKHAKKMKPTPSKRLSKRISDEYRRSASKSVGTRRKEDIVNEKFGQPPSKVYAGGKEHWVFDPKYNEKRSLHVSKYSGRPPKDADRTMTIEKLDNKLSELSKKKT